MTNFRVHTAEGDFDVQAANPTEARKIVLQKRPGIIVNKIKVLKEK